MANINFSENEVIEFKKTIGEFSMKEIRKIILKDENEIGKWESRILWI